MDSKRKANGTTTPDDDDRASKRRKLAEFDLSKGESRDSTTAYGMAFLEQIRRTQDKSGRHVATYFETLPAKENNAEYYKRTRMPISLKSIEKKLDNGEFRTLAELESYLKRMISNAKEFYPRSSPTYDDAERIRKAVSNYMTKTNPAYQKRGYQALPTPLPPEDGEEAEEGEEEEEEDEEAEAEEEEEEEQEAANDAEEEEDDEEEEEEDEAEEAEAEEPSGRSSRKRSIILKRRGPTRPSRNSISSVQDTPSRLASQARPDHQYEDVPYKGLNFQQAQEKVVEELLRYQEPDYDSPYFEPFVNLPPRALKDYYKMVSDPLSLKKLQKIVKGVQGRGEPTNVSEFKTWGQFSERAKLLWTNAYYYNEEGSEIYQLAQELEGYVKKEIKKAQAAVPEPAQAKIKLKVGQQAEQSSSKKITLHVGGRATSTNSPAPETIESPTPGQDANGTHTQMTLAPIERTRNASAAADSPTPAGIKGEDSSAARPASATSGSMTPSGPKPPMPVIQQPYVPPPPPGPPMEQKRFRSEGKGAKDALISKVMLQSFQNIHADKSAIVKILPDAKEMQQCVTLNLPATHNRLALAVTLPEFLQNRQHSLWTLVDKQPLKPSNIGVVPHLAQDRVFETMLHPGLNVIEAHLIAAIPREERTAGGPEAELEVFTIFVNVARV